MPTYVYRCDTCEIDVYFQFTIDEFDRKSKKVRCETCGERVDYNWQANTQNINGQRKFCEGAFKEEKVALGPNITSTKDIDNMGVRHIGDSKVKPRERK